MEAFFERDLVLCQKLLIRSIETAGKNVLRFGTALSRLWDNSPDVLTSSLYYISCSAVHMSRHLDIIPLLYQLLSCPHVSSRQLSRHLDIILSLYVARLNICLHSYCKFKKWKNSVSVFYHILCLYIYLYICMCVRVWDCNTNPAIMTHHNKNFTRAIHLKYFYRIKQFPVKFATE